LRREKPVEKSDTPVLGELIPPKNQRNCYEGDPGALHRQFLREGKK
jgi:hypothetical protein